MYFHFVTGRALAIGRESVCRRDVGNYGYVLQWNQALVQFYQSIIHTDRDSSVQAAVK